MATTSCVCRQSIGSAPDPPNPDWRSDADAVAHLAGYRRNWTSGPPSARGLTETALARIADPGGEGERAFTRVYAKAALLQADTADRLHAAGISPSPIAGVPISVKDLFDVAGM